jgi:RimJ/RimL family protein N-acetyltransferase
MITTFDNFTLRLLTKNDLNNYYSLIENNRKRLEDFFAGTVAITKTIDDTRVHLDDVTEKAASNNYFPFIVIDNETGKIISSLQVKSIDWSIPKAELGYYIDVDYEGKGIVTKSINKIIDYCFRDLEMHKLYIRTHESNISSIMVAEKNGFIKEGVIRSDYKTTKGELIDVIYYGLLREEYLKKG